VEAGEISPESRERGVTKVRVMEVYTYICGYIPLLNMSRRTQVTLTDRQHSFLLTESFRTGLSVAELVRRAIDGTYRPQLRPKVRGFELSAGFWKHPDAAIVGRRPGRRLFEH
jgi:hypothetical protein